MTKRVRFGAFIRELRIQQTQVSANDLAALIEKDDSLAVQLRSVDVYRLIRPYLQVRFNEQMRAVLPLAIYLALFQILILRQGVEDAWILGAGLLAVIVGLMIFMEGLKVGLMPFGESIGSKLPATSTLPMVLLIVFLLGIGVTFAEPAIGALQTAGRLVDVREAPYLYALLNEWAFPLVLIIGVGVGTAAILGTMRFIKGWSLKPLIFLILTPIMVLTVYMAFNAQLSKILGLAWDCGAVTTGPVTVPLVLALGIGIAHSAGKGGGSLSGFGIVTMASLFPILGVQLLGLYVAVTVPVEEIIASASVASQSAEQAWYEVTPGVEIVGGVRAIVPLVIFLFLVLVGLLHERVKEPVNITYGITLCVVGMIVFNLGLSYGLAKLGGQSGGLVPSAFTQIDAVEGSPLYGVVIGLSIAIAFACVLGFGATLAEPALNALGLTVENLTNGAFRKSTLIYAVSVGVACGIGLGVAKIIFDIPIAWLLIPGYGVAILLTVMSSEEFVNIAWDSAGVTTGPVTVPLVLAMGLGLGDSVGAIEGFGILSMASIGPIIAVLATGLRVRMRQLRWHAESEAKATA